MSVLPQRFSLLKRSNGFYYVLWYQNGRQRWKSTKATTKPEALKALTKFKELFQEQVRSVSFEQFATQFLAYAEANLSLNTVRMYRTIFRTFGRFVHSSYLNELTPETIDRYKTKRLKEISPVSVNIELRMIKAAFSTAKRWRVTEQNPLEDIPFARVPEQAPLALTHEDFQKLLACIRESWFRKLVVFAVSTGMRRGEILNLRWQDVDLTRRTLTIQTSEIFRTKHGKRRTIPLNDTAFFILTSRHGKSPSEYVFNLNDRPIYDGWVSHLFKRYVREANLSNPRFRFHSLRHSFCTWLVESGVPLAHVQALVGHSSVTVTEGYSHLAATELHTAVNKISLPLN